MKDIFFFKKKKIKFKDIFSNIKRKDFIGDVKPLNSAKQNDISFSTINNHKYLQPGKKLNKSEILFKKIIKNND